MRLLPGPLSAASVHQRENIMKKFTIHVGQKKSFPIRTVAPLGPRRSVSIRFIRPGKPSPTKGRPQPKVLVNMKMKLCWNTNRTPVPSKSSQQTDRLILLRPKGDQWGGKTKQNKNHGLLVFEAGSQFVYRIKRSNNRLMMCFFML